MTSSICPHHPKADTGPSDYHPCQGHSPGLRSSERSQCAENNISHNSVTENDVFLVSLSLEVRRRGTPRGKGQVASLHVTTVCGHVLEQQSWKGLHKLFRQFPVLTLS